MRTCNLISRADAVREALRFYQDARETVRKCREAEDDFGTLAFECQKESFRWMAMVLMALPAADTDVGGKDNNVPTNEPLTIEELREMNGEPVWIVDVGPHKWYGPGWAIVDRDNCLVRTVKNWNAVFFESYGERWLAYRRPPEVQS